MGKDMQPCSESKLTFCLSNHLASLTDNFGTGCVINTLNLYNSLSKVIDQSHGSAQTRSMGISLAMEVRRRLIFAIAYSILIEVGISSWHNRST